MSLFIFFHIIFNMKLTFKQKIKIEETLKDFICLLSRYNQVKDDDVLLDLFLSRNRNPLFDLTGSNFWNTGLSSKNALNDKGKKVKDHFIPRKIAMGYIMEKLNSDPNITLDDFIDLCKRYGSTIYLTKEEHKKITSVAKNTGKSNYEFYEECGVVVEGIDELINKIKM